MSVVGRRKATLVRLSDGDPGNIAVGAAIAVFGNNQAVLADPSDLERMPAIGLAVSVRSGSVVVQTNSVLTANRSDIEAGKTYWVDSSNPGEITATPAETPSDGQAELAGYMTQIIGIGTSPSSILITPDPSGLIF